MNEQVKIEQWGGDLMKELSIYCDNRIAVFKNTKSSKPNIRSRLMRFSLRCVSKVKPLSLSTDRHMSSVGTTCWYIIRILFWRDAPKVLILKT